MDEQAFQSEDSGRSLHDQATVLISGGPLKNKRGHAHLTNDRVLFMDQRFDPNQSRAVGGLLAGALAEQLEKRWKERPPMVDLPLTEITRVSRVKKLTVRDILVIETAAGRPDSRMASKRGTRSSGGPSPSVMAGPSWTTGRTHGR